MIKHALGRSVSLGTLWHPRRRLEACRKATPETSNMELRRVLKFNGTMGMTIPNKFSSVLGLHWQDYVEIYLADTETIVVRKHKEPKRKEFPHGTTEHPITATT